MPNPTKVKQATMAPTRKVAIGGVAGALTGIVVWVLNVFVLPEGTQVPGEIGSALTVILTFMVGYLVPPSASDEVVPAGS